MYDKRQIVIFFSFFMCNVNKHFVIDLKKNPRRNWPFSQFDNLKCYMVWLHEVSFSSVPWSNAFIQSAEEIIVAIWTL